MKWNEVVIKTGYDAYEAVTNYLNEAGAIGLVIEDPRDIEFLSREEYIWDYIDDEITKDWYDGVVVRAFFTEDFDINEIKLELHRFVEKLKEYGIDSGNTEIEINEVEDRDWNEEWKKHYEPFRLGKKIVIKPTWEDYEQKPGDIIIEIDPGMAFGTGTHETTEMCVEAIEETIEEGYKVLDIGTGTGILSIAACKLGAEKVTAIDIDDKCVKAARENVGENNCSETIEVVKGDLLSDYSGKNHIILANISKEIIVGLLPHIDQYLEKKGKVILSGILDKDGHQVEKVLAENGFDIIEKKSRGEWVCYAAERK